MWVLIFALIYTPIFSFNFFSPVGKDVRRTKNYQRVIFSVQHCDIVGHKEPLELPARLLVKKLDMSFVVFAETLTPFNLSAVIFCSCSHLYSTNLRIGVQYPNALYCQIHPVCSLGIEV